MRLRVKKFSTNGFTLIEMLVVVAIIGILASVVTIAVSTISRKAIVARAQVFDTTLYHTFGSDSLAVWNFDDGYFAPTSTSALAIDDSEYHNDLTMANDPTVLWASSSDAYKGQSALVVKGGIVDAPASTTIPHFNLSDGSVSFWLNLKTPSGSGIFCNNGDITTFAQFCILDTGTTGKFIEADWDGGGIGKHVETDLNPKDYLGVWTHVAVSWDIPQGETTGTIHIYINGKDVASSSEYTAASDFASPYPVCIGGDCHEDNIIGSLDEMRVYSHSIQNS